jgi:hypothetical protein
VDEAFRLAFRRPADCREFLSGRDWSYPADDKRRKIPEVREMTSTTYAAVGDYPQEATHQNAEPAAKRMDQQRFWVGAILTSAVAGLAGVIGLIIAQDLLHVPLTLSSTGVPILHVGSYGTLIGLFSMLAGVLYAGMVAFAPRPTVYYGTLTGLLTALAVLLPFTASGSLTAQLALAAINLVVGVLIMTLIPIAAVNAEPRS